MNKLSVVISAHNEEKNIGNCLKSIEKLADEIIVVDNSSSDKTAEVARKFTKKVYQQENNPEKIDLQKNFGFSKSTGDWILSLDADEQVPQDLAAEIKNVLTQPQNSNSHLLVGFWIPRKNIIFGKWIQHTGWSPDHQLRLFKKGRGKFGNEKVHEPLIVEGETATLTASIVHENYQGINQFISRLMVYTDSESKALIEEGYKLKPTDIVRRPFEEFLRRYFSENGYRDGLHGLSLSMLMAFYHLVIFLKIWEHEKFVESEIDISKSFKDESKKIAREVAYWIAESERRETKNPVKRLFLRTSQKISSKK